MVKCLNVATFKMPIFCKVKNRNSSVLIIEHISMSSYAEVTNF